MSATAVVWTTQIVWTLISLYFVVRTLACTDDWIALANEVQALLFISTLAAMLVLFVDVGSGVSLRDEFRAFTVRPEILIVQFLVYQRVKKTRPRSMSQDDVVEQEQWRT